MYTSQDPILLLYNMNRNLQDFLEDHQQYCKIQDTKIAEEKSKNESQKLMKLVFQYENVHWELEESFNTKIEKIKEELRIECEINNALQNKFQELDDQLNEQKTILKQEAQIHEAMRDEMDDMANKHKKKISSLMLTYEQDKYIAANLKTETQTMVTEESEDAPIISYKGYSFPEKDRSAKKERDTNTNINAKTANKSVRKRSSKK